MSTADRIWLVPTGRHIAVGDAQPLLVLTFLFLFLGSFRRDHIIISKEAVLRQDLKVMRDQINNYTRDKETAPQTLQDLVDAGYLRQIPKDPFTDSAQTGEVEKSDEVASVDQTWHFRCAQRLESHRKGWDALQQLVNCSTPLRDHSVLNAFIGSIAAALPAGSKLATNAQSPSTAIAAIKLVGSNLPMPYS